MFRAVVYDDYDRSNRYTVVGTFATAGEAWQEAQRYAGKGVSVSVLDRNGQGVPPRRTEGGYTEACRPRD